MKTEQFRALHVKAFVVCCMCPKRDTKGGRLRVSCFFLSLLDEGVVLSTALFRTQNQWKEESA